MDGRASITFIPSIGYRGGRGISRPNLRQVSVEYRNRLWKIQWVTKTQWAMNGNGVGGNLWVFLIRRGGGGRCLRPESNQHRINTYAFVFIVFMKPEFLNLTVKC